MPIESRWTLKTATAVLIFTIIALPFWMIWGPIYVIIRTIVTIWQPYLYRIQSERWNELYQEQIRKGIFIDYPPAQGTIFGIGPWKQCRVDGL